MKQINEFRKAILIFCLTVTTTMSCTKLDEKLYDKILAKDFLQTREDVIKDFLRSFEHGYWTVQGVSAFSSQELPGDQLITPTRDGDWFEGGLYQRMHYHTWTPQDQYTSDLWIVFFMGINLATNSLEDMQTIDPIKLNVTEVEKADFIAELKALRAWYHLRAFDVYRNIPIVTKYKGETESPDQSTPQEVFDYIEKELLDAMPGLPMIQDLGDAAIGRFTKGSAAAMLMRLYLNAQVYIGQDKFAECAKIAQDIIDGVYGDHELEETWDGVFAYTNAQSSEILFGFPSSFALTHWHYEDMYFHMAPPQAQFYFGFTDLPIYSKYSLAPGRDVDSVEYSATLGKPFVKFQRYPDDFRLKKYKNLGNSKREGMFLYGYLPYTDGNGNTQYVKSTRGYTIFARDQVGWFKDTPPGTPLTDKESNINHADDNSGVWPVKYPVYPSNDANKVTSAFAEIRLAEVYYSLAECKYRAGDKAGAASLLNSVRKRNYPTGSPSLYSPSGAELTDEEMLDEWGREFLLESRRRTDLIRWGIFNTGTWWDKQPDADDHTKIFPIGIDVINLLPNIKQNPGY